MLRKFVFASLAMTILSSGAYAQDAIKIGASMPITGPTERMSELLLSSGRGR